jgi:hypothetical protein
VSDGGTVGLAGAISAPIPALCIPPPRAWLADGPVRTSSAVTTMSLFIFISVEALSPFQGKPFRAVKTVSRGRRSA